jgi:hypothetical protein
VYYSPTNCKLDFVKIDDIIHLNMTNTTETRLNIVGAASLFQVQPGDKEGKFECFYPEQWYRSNDPKHPDYFVQYTTQYITPALTVQEIQPQDKAERFHQAFLLFQLHLDEEGFIEGIAENTTIHLTLHQKNLDHAYNPKRYYLCEYSADGDRSTHARITKIGLFKHFTSSLGESTRPIIDFLTPDQTYFQLVVSKSGLPEVIDWMATLKMYVDGQRPDGSSLTAENILDNPVLPVSV